MDELNNLSSLGLELPSPAYLLGSLLFGILGFACYRYGKKNADTASKWVGVALMLYPYLITETWLLYAVGGVLCVGLAVIRR